MTTKQSKSKAKAKSTKPKVSSFNLEVALKDNGHLVVSTDAWGKNYKHRVDLSKSFGFGLKDEAIKAMHDIVDNYSKHL